LVLGVIDRFLPRLVAIVGLVDDVVDVVEFVAVERVVFVALKSSKTSIVPLLWTRTHSSQYGNTVYAPVGWGSLWKSKPSALALMIRSSGGRSVGSFPSASPTVSTIRVESFVLGPS
jgi:hypothetical protein